MKNLISRFLPSENPIQKYIETPKAGRLAPQPNMDLAMTHFVFWVLRLK